MTPPLQLCFCPRPLHLPHCFSVFSGLFFCTICSSACDSRPSRSVFTAPSTSSPLYIPYVFTLAFSGKPSRRAPRQYLCCSERRLHFFSPPTPSLAFYHLNIPPKQLIYSAGFVPALFLLPLPSCPELATPRLRMKEEDQGTRGARGEKGSKWSRVAAVK